MRSESDGRGIPSERVDQSAASGSLQAELDDLSTSESGLAFIYSALDLLARRFQLFDVVIVVENEDVGTQMFRLGGKAVSRDFARRHDIAPGIYCEPPVVAADELEMVRSACQRALSYQRTHFFGAKDSLARSTPEHAETLAPPTVIERSDLTSKHRYVPTHDGRRTPDNTSRTTDPRLIISQILLFVDVVTFVMTVTDVHGPLRYVLGLILGIVIPGWSIVGLIKLRNAALELSLTIATSLALVMVAAQILITVHLWHPIVLEEFTCLVCLPSLLRQSRRRRRRPEHSK
ncbi:MAG: hypothetical protein WBD82_09090 [Acidimicrobiales bacterium]